MAFRTTSKKGDAQLTAEEINQGKDTTEWFDKIETIPAPIKAVLESYSDLEDDQIIPHIEDIRARAFRQWPYPSIGQLRFLDLNLSKHPYYPTVLSRLKEGQTYLDAGCCFAQDLRKLLFDGAPDSKALYGLDIEGPFLDLGYELFRDREKFHGTLLPVDLLNHSAPIPQFDDEIDIVGIFSLLHFFQYDQQVEMVKRMVRFSRPVPGSAMLGRQLGAPRGGVYGGLMKDTETYLHSVETFNKLWQDVGQQTDSKWEVDAYLVPVEAKLSSQSWAYEGMSWLYFRVSRL